MVNKVGKNSQGKIANQKRPWLEGYGERQGLDNRTVQITGDECEKLEKVMGSGDVGLYVRCSFYLGHP